MKRARKAPTPSDTEYALVQFIEDKEYTILPSDKVEDHEDGRGHVAPYGPHNKLYRCIVQRKSESKEELIKILKALDSAYAVKKRKVVPKATEATDKEESRQKEKPATPNESGERMRKVDEKKSEQVKKKEELAKKKAEQIKKKEEKEKERNITLNRNKSLIQQMNDFNDISFEIDEGVITELVSDDEVGEDETLIKQATELLKVPDDKTLSSKNPKLGKKCPRKNFPEKSCLGCQEKDKEIATLKQQLDAQRVQHNTEKSKAAQPETKPITRPRAGKVEKNVASMYQMQELVPGSGIYVYPLHLDGAAKRQTSTSAARYLLSCFYTPTELITAGNLTGRNNKRGLDGDIIEAIVAYVTKGNNQKPSVIRSALRCKVEGLKNQRIKQDKKP